MDISDPTSSALSWAQDANSYVCTVVMPDGISAITGKDLSTTYYDSVVPSVEVLIARGQYHLFFLDDKHVTDRLKIAGYRLAAWLNLIATGDIGLTAETNATSSESLRRLRRGIYNDDSRAKLARRQFGYLCSH